MTRIFLVLVFAAIFAIGLACSADNPAPVSNSNATAEPVASVDPHASGRKLYKEHCARCHMDDGTGGRVEVDGETLRVEDLSTEKMAEESDEEYIEYMVEGIPEEGMPSFKDEMTKAEMQEVVDYIRAEFQGN